MQAGLDCTERPEHHPKTRAIVKARELGKKPARVVMMSKMENADSLPIRDPTPNAPRPKPSILTISGRQITQLRWLLT
jgi:hypothetical protein